MTDPDHYEIIAICPVGPHIVIKVKYPDCENCSFGAQKILVILNTSIVAALKWRRIDPHFTDEVRAATEAPGPSARFPASGDGWNDAIAYAETKVGARISPPDWYSKGLDDTRERIKWVIESYGLAWDEQETDTGWVYQSRRKIRDIERPVMIKLSTNGDLAIYEHTTEKSTMYSNYTLQETIDWIGGHSSDKHQ